MKNFLLVAAAALMPALTTAHYHFPHLIVNNQVFGPMQHVREHDNGYMPSWDNGAFLNNPDMRCNKGAQRHAGKVQAYKVTAGKDTIGFQTNLGARIEHPGPLTIYLSRAPGQVSQYDGSGPWFKVFQIGVVPNYNGDDQGWLVWRKNKFTFQLPAEIPAGQYLMRAEHMAVHQPYKHKEFFLQCAHLDIQSNYNGPAPGPSISFPGGYSMNDKAIQFDSWAKPFQQAVMPGPAMWPNNKNFNNMAGVS